MNKKLISILLIVLMSGLLCGCISESKDKDDVKPIQLEPYKYTTYYQGDYVTIHSPQPTVHADMPREGYRMIYIEVDLTNPTERTVMDLEARVDIPEGWELNGIASGENMTFQWYEDIDTTLPAHTTPGQYQLGFLIFTEDAPMFLGYDKNHDGFADIYNSDDNFDDVNCENEGYDKIWSDGCKPGYYSVKLHVWGSNTKEIELEYRVVMFDE